MTHYPQHDRHSLSLNSSYRRGQILTGNHVIDLLWESPVTRPETYSIKEISVCRYQKVVLWEWKSVKRSGTVGQTDQNSHLPMSGLAQGTGKPLGGGSLFPESCLPKHGARTLVPILQKRILMSPVFVTIYTSMQEKHSIPHVCNYKFMGHRGDMV